MSDLVCHPERSEGSLPIGRSFAALRMTMLFIDQMKIDNILTLDRAGQDTTYEVALQGEEDHQRQGH
jgi:hypothetical protein